MAIRIIVIEVFSVVNVFLFYCRLPSNIYCIKIIHFLSSSQVYKSSMNINLSYSRYNNQSTLSYFKLNSQYLAFKSHWRILFIMWIQKSYYFQANKDDILDRCKIRATFAPPTFEDKERLQAHGNGIEIWLPWDNLYQERKREIAT